MKRRIILLLLLSVSLFAASATKETGKPITITDIGQNITLNGHVAGTVQFTLYDLQGRRLHRTRKVVHPGANQLILPKNIQKNQVVVMEMSDGRWKYSEQVVLR